MRFPVVGERRPSSELSDQAGWHLEIVGEVGREIEFDLDRFVRIAQTDLTFDVHCVTSWSRFGSTFRGISLRDLVEEARVSKSAKYVSFEAFSERGHHTSLPLPVALSDSWVVHSFDGQPLTTDHGGPVRVVTPGRYFYKSLKWLKRIVFLEEDRLGWWESNSAYHNNADPWAGNERFTTGSIRPEQLARFIGASNYDKYRGRVMIGLDLRTWQPSRDLRRLHLKNCDLRAVDLAGADLRDSNLSLSDLRGANLQGADLSGSDLEGANFAGADLREANLEGCALSAARFHDETGQANVSGTRLLGSWGLTESEEAFLARAANPGPAQPAERHDPGA